MENSADMQYCCFLTIYLHSTACNQQKNQAILACNAQQASADSSHFESNALLGSRKTLSLAALLKGQDLPARSAQGG